jgi:hypothetical protein
MKFIFLSGGVIGFLIAGISGLAAGRSPDNVLLDAALGCLAGALLFQWLWSIFLRGFRETYLARHHPAPAPAPAAAAVLPAKTTKS